MLDHAGFTLVECKTADDLRRDAEKPHPRFERVDSGWRWPAACDAASALGLHHKVFSSEEIDPVWLRNVSFLSDFTAAPCPGEEAARPILAALREAGSALVVRLLALPGICADVFWGLVAHRRIWCDIDRERVFEVDTAWVHVSAERMLAQRHLRLAPDRSACTTLSGPPPPHCVSVDPGAVLVWDGVPWRVVNRGATSVTLRCDDGSDRVDSLSFPDLKRLLDVAAITCAASDASDPVPDEADRLLRLATPDDLRLATRRMAAVEHYLSHGRILPGVGRRTLRRYLRWFNDAQSRYGMGYLGLVRRRGRRPGSSNLPAPEREALDEVVAEFADDRKAGRLSAAPARLVSLCEERGLLAAPSEETLRRALLRRSDPDMERARRGSGAAYQIEGPLPGAGAVWPTHGDRVFELGHIDHTPLDLQLVSHRTGAVLGKAWLTLLIDSFSRMPLAFVLSFDAPGRASVLAALYDCVARHHRLPDTLVVDQGPEFHSSDLENALAALRVSKQERPARKPRFGAVVERMFGIANTRLVHELQGNTTVLSLGRSLSPSRHPKRNAAWSLPMLTSACEQWLFEVYPDLVHGSLGAQPRDVFRHNLASHGQRLARYVPLDQHLRVLLAMTPRGGTRRVHPSRGVVIDYLRYWNDDFEYGDVVDVPVKVDPADCSIAYAYVRGAWVVCRLADGGADLQGRSWRQIRLAVDALRTQYRQGRAARPINAVAIGRFLRESDLTGALARQVALDAESCSVPPGPSADRTPSLYLAAQDGSRRSSPGAGPSSPVLRPVPSECPQDDDSDLDHLEPYDVG